MFRARKVTDDFGHFYNQSIGGPPGFLWSSNLAWVTYEKKEADLQNVFQIDIAEYPLLGRLAEVMRPSCAGNSLGQS